LPVVQGDRVLLAWVANRDAKQFDEPDELDIDRWPNRHRLRRRRAPLRRVAPRAILQEILGQILERMPDYVIVSTRCSLSAQGHQHRLAAHPGDVHARPAPRKPSTSTNPLSDSTTFTCVRTVRYACRHSEPAYCERVSG
jgi:hypothetical protein